VKVTVYFEDSGQTYEVDFLKLAKHLGLTEADVRTAVNNQLATT